LFVSVFPGLVLVWFFLWLPEEELTLLFLLHCENGDFSILMKDIVYWPELKKNTLVNACQVEWNTSITIWK
jgi:hypothetical protein